MWNKFLWLHTLFSLISLGTTQSFSHEPLSHIVFIHLGSPPPPCADITLQQARFMNEEAEIYFLMDHQNYEKIAKEKKDFIQQNRILLIDLSSVPKSVAHCLYQQISPFDSTFKQGFWNHTTERFFYLDDFLTATELSNVFHLETDVMLYANLQELLPFFLDSGAELAGTFQWITECVPGFVFIRNQSIWQKYIDHLITELQSYQGNDPHTELNDMRTLASFRKNREKEFINLPIVMPEYKAPYPLRKVKSKEKRGSLEFLSDSSSLFPGYLFDAAAFGIYANGYDKTVYPEGHPGDIHWKSLFDPSYIGFSWGKDPRGKPVPYATLSGKSYRIVTLHFHSKHPERFTSFGKKRMPFPQTRQPPQGPSQINSSI